MAKVVSDDPDSIFAQRGSIYPWDEWLDGRVWRLRRGEDFRVMMNSMRSSAGAAARVRGKSIRTAIAGDYLYVQAVPDRKAAAQEAG